VKNAFVAFGVMCLMVSAHAADKLDENETVQLSRNFERLHRTG